MGRITLYSFDVMAYTLMGFAILFTSGRIAIRLLKFRKIQTDDILHVLALFSLIVYTAVSMSYLPDIYAEQDKKETKAQAYKILKFNVINVSTFFSTLYLVKASFLALYWQLFRISRAFRWAWMLVAVFTAISFLVSFLITFWNCGSPYKIQDLKACSAKDTVARERKFIILATVLNVVSDVAIMALPLGVLHTLQMRLTQKLGLAAVFLLATSTVILDILRCAASAGLLSGGLIKESPIWTVLEPDIAVIVNALPTYYTLFNREKKTTVQYNDWGNMRSPMNKSNVSGTTVTTATATSGTKESRSYADVELRELDEMKVEERYHAV